MHKIGEFILLATTFAMLCGCTDQHQPADCPPACPNGMNTTNIRETDQFMIGQWELFLRQISADNATEITGKISVVRKLSPGVYQGTINGEGRFMKFNHKVWDCGTLEPSTLVCRDKELIESINAEVTVSTSKDGIELQFKKKLNNFSIYMDVKDGYFERTAGKKFKTGEETYVMAKVINGKSALDTMDTRTIKID